MIEVTAITVNRRALGERGVGAFIVSNGVFPPTRQEVERFRPGGLWLNVELILEPKISKRSFLHLLHKSEGHQLESGEVRRVWSKGASS